MYDKYKSRHHGKVYVGMYRIDGGIISTHVLENPTDEEISACVVEGWTLNDPDRQDETF